MSHAAPTITEDRGAVLRVEGLNIDFVTDAGAVPAVRGVDFTVKAGRSWPSWANPGPASQ